jgi:ubiquinone/menaquinone biosynthesis C-methylase UbiE
MPVGPVKVISLCAGQGRDVTGVVAGHGRVGDVQAVLVEADRSNCEYARNAAISDGLTGIRIVCGDASDTSVVRDDVPADVLLLCGIFGNVSDEDVERTVRNCSRLCAPGAWVIWTRHRQAPDLTVSIRDWFAQSGFRLVAFDAQDDDTAAVGTQQLTAEPLPFTPDLRLFTFNR